MNLSERLFLWQFIHNKHGISIRCEVIAIPRSH